jgi:hypothetical protein
LAGNVARVRDPGRYWVSVRKHERKILIGIPKYRWEDNTKTGLTKHRRLWTGLIGLRKSGGLF